MIAVLNLAVDVIESQPATDPSTPVDVAGCHGPPLTWLPPGCP